jgi:hypothetical protein
MTIVSKDVEVSVARCMGNEHSKEFCDMFHGKASNLPPYPMPGIPTFPQILGHTHPNIHLLWHPPSQFVA